MIDVNFEAILLTMLPQMALIGMMWGDLRAKVNANRDELSKANERILRLESNAMGADQLRSQS